MKRKYLSEIYTILYANVSDLLYRGKFEKNNYWHREKMQKCIYLLQELGVPLQYDFRWTSKGVISKELIVDMKRIPLKNKEPLHLDDEGMEYLEKLKLVIEENVKTHYADVEWIQCIATIRYIKKNRI